MALIEKIAGRAKYGRDSDTEGDASSETADESFADPSASEASSTDANSDESFTDASGDDESAGASDDRYVASDDEPATDASDGEASATDAPADRARTDKKIYYDEATDAPADEEIPASNTIAGEASDTASDEADASDAAVDTAVSEDEFVDDASASDPVLASPANPQLAEPEKPVLDVSATDDEVLSNTIDDLGLNDLSGDVAQSPERPVLEEPSKPAEPETEVAIDASMPIVVGDAPAAVQDGTHVEVVGIGAAANESTLEVNVHAIEDFTNAGGDADADSVVNWALLPDQAVAAYDAINDISTSAGSPSIDNVIPSGEVPVNDYVPIFDEIVSKPEVPQGAAEPFSIGDISILDAGDLALPSDDPVGFGTAEDVPATAPIADGQAEAGGAVAAQPVHPGTDELVQDAAPESPPAVLPLADPAHVPLVGAMFDASELLQIEFDQPEQAIAEDDAAEEPSTGIVQAEQVAKNASDPTTVLPPQAETSPSTVPPTATISEDASPALPSTAGFITTVATTTQIVYVTPTTVIAENAPTFTQFVTATVTVQSPPPPEDSLGLEDWEAADAPPQVVNKPASSQPQQDPQWTRPPHGHNRPRPPPRQEPFRPRLPPHQDDDYESYESAPGHRQPLRPRQPVNIGDLPRGQEYNEDFNSEQQEEWSYDEPQAVPHPGRRPPHPAQPIYDREDVTYSEGDQTLMETDKQPPASDSVQSIGTPDYDEPNQQSIVD